MKRQRETAASVKTSKSKKKAKDAPIVKEVYSSEKYWDDRYMAGGNHTWYYEYDDLKPLLDECCGPQDTVVEIGCGDSPLLTGMAADRDKNRQQYKDAVFGRLMGIDFSKTIIDTLERQRQESIISNQGSSSSTQDSAGLSQEAADSLSYHCLDARDMTPLFPDPSQYCRDCVTTTVTTSSSTITVAGDDTNNNDIETGTVDLIIDKGTMDAMLCGNNDHDKGKVMAEGEKVNSTKNHRSRSRSNSSSSGSSSASEEEDDDDSGEEQEEGFANVRAMFAEALRITKRRSAYMLISHMQFESDAFQEVLTEAIMPVLEAIGVRDRRWELEVHTHEALEEEEEEEENGGQDSKGDKEKGDGDNHSDDDDSEQARANREHPAVYIFRSQPRRSTRSMAAHSAPLTITVREH